MPSRLQQPQLRVLVVDADRQLWSSAAGLREGELLLSGAGCDYRGLVEEVRRQDPDVVVIDFAPGGAALSAIERVMAEAPKPVLVLHGPGVSKAEAFAALDLGALDIDSRPEPVPPSFWTSLSAKLRLLATVRVVQHVGGRRRRRSAHRGRSKLPFPVVAIAASLGGPKALAQVVRNLPESFAAPILVCQHISDGFTSGLAQWLGSETRLRVVEPQDGEPLAPGSVYIAPSGFHLVLHEELKIRLSDEPPVAGFKPSCDRLLESVAAVGGAQAIGIVLTGMGRDGARGLLSIKAAGGRTMAQDEASCVVFGMPREAIAMGAAEEVVPLDEIASVLTRWVES